STSLPARTIDYPDETPLIFPIEFEDFFPEEIQSIDPRLLTLRASPEAEEGIYHSAQAQPGPTQYDPSSCSDSSLDNCSPPYLAGSKTGDYLTCTADEAQPVTPVREYSNPNSTSGQSPDDLAKGNKNEELICPICGKDKFKLPCHLRNAVAWFPIAPRGSLASGILIDTTGSCTPNHSGALWSGINAPTVLMRRIEEITPRGIWKLYIRMNRSLLNGILVPKTKIRDGNKVAA
ncbi:hypothetical protein ACJ72_08124, partial [Emergomyces africanus]